MTYRQKKRVIAKLKRIQNFIKYQDFGCYGPDVYKALQLIDCVIRLHLDEPCDFHRCKSLPNRIWSDAKKKI